MVSDNLDEKRIMELRRAGAAIDTWGVGTSLVTAAGAGALGGVYKLSAIRRAGDKRWRPVFKLGAGVGKASLPGRLQVRRYRSGGGVLERDVIYAVDEEAGPHAVSAPEGGRDLLSPILDRGRLVETLPTLEMCREVARREVAALPVGLLDLDCHAPSPVEVAPELLGLCDELAAEHRVSDRSE